MLGGVVAFMTYAFVTGKVDEELRYFIVAIPLVIVMVGVAVAAPDRDRVPAADRAAGDPADGGRGAASRCASRAPSRGRGRPAPERRRGRRHGGDDPRSATWGSAIPPSTPTRPMAVQAVVNRGTLTQAQSAAMSRDRVDVAVSRYVDALNAGPGSVLLDDFLGYVIVMKSAHQDQYVITSDTDFQQILSDPSANGVEYVLVPSDRGMGTLDAVNRAYPGAYATGQRHRDPA